MNTPEVSVIIPVYNGAAFIERAINSALQQVPPPKEIFVVDDGSTDDTAAIVRGFSPPVRLLQQKNAGPAAARNHGARFATGEWLAFLDADDAWLPGKLEAQLRLSIDAKVAVISCLVTKGYWHGIPPSEIGFDRLWQRNCIALSTTLVRRTLFHEFGGFDEDKKLIGVEDYNLWLRMSSRGWRLVTLQEVLCLYTPGSGSLTAQVQRFAQAELVNLEKLAHELRISDRQVRNKRGAILHQYGREFFYERDGTRARNYFRSALGCTPTLSSLGWWLLCFCPDRVLTLARDTRKRFPDARVGISSR